MNISLNKNTNEQILDYINFIDDKVFENKMKNHKSKKTNCCDDVIPTIKNINNLLDFNYTVYHLKTFAKHYKLKLAGTKKQLIKRLYCYIYLSSCIIKIQKIFRGFLQKKFNQLKGPGLFKRNLCINKTDFLTFENINEIDYHQFFSFKDEDNFIYGFDLTSIYNLIYTAKGNTYVLNENIKNPYNRNLISQQTINTIKKIIKLSKYLNSDVNIKIKNVNEDLPIQKTIELRTLDIFQTINQLGNYSDYKWFLDLDKRKLIVFINELYDIWNYRIEIDNDTKIMICPPNGNPFVYLNNYYLTNETNINNIRKIILDIMHKLVSSGLNNDYKILGAYYILCALTLVSENAAIHLPWLYNSVY